MHLYCHKNLSYCHLCVLDLVLERLLSPSSSPPTTNERVQKQQLSPPPLTADWLPPPCVPLNYSAFFTQTNLTKHLLVKVPRSVCGNDGPAHSETGNCLNCSRHKSGFFLFKLESRKLTERKLF